MDHKFPRLYFPALIYMAVIFVFSCFHKVPLPFIDRLSTDKIYHLIEYGILGFLLMRILVLGEFKMNYCWKVVAVLALGSIYGVSDEIHQYFVPGRYFSYWDMAADSAGSLLGAVLYNRWGTKLEKSISKFKL